MSTMIRAAAVFLLLALCVVCETTNQLYSVPTLRPNFTTPVNKAVAKLLGMSDWRRLSSRFHPEFNVRQCLTAFGKYYRSFEPLGSGWFGAVYRLHAHRRDIHPGFVMKSVPFEYKNGFLEFITRVGGIRRLDEILAGKALVEALEETKGSKAFVSTLDWFYCNEASMKYLFMQKKNQNHKESEGNVDFSFLEKNPSMNRLTHQFVIIREIPGISLNDALMDFDFGKVEVAPMVEFIRSLSYQITFPQAVAFNATQFAHFDLNPRNVMLEGFEVDGFPQKSKGYFGYVDQKGRRALIPKNATSGSMAKIFDYGTAAITFPVSKTMKHRVGPSVMLQYTVEDSIAVNLRYFYLFFITTIPRKFYLRWKEEDPESYEQFSEVWAKAGGFEHFAWYERKLLATIRFTRWNACKSGKCQEKRYNRDLADYGMSEWVRHSPFRQRFHEAYVSSVFSILTRAATHFKEKSNIKFEDVLDMEFFGVYRRNDVQLDGSIETVGRLNGKPSIHRTKTRQ